MRSLFEEHIILILICLLSIISIVCFIYYLNDGLSLAYNDARSHLDIGRRVVESLKPGLAQLGSVWLPLPHILMIPTVWDNFFWHTGLSGALPSMISFVATGILIYAFLKRLEVNMLGRLVGVGIFVANLNILYMQSTAMTELLLIVTMTAGVYELLRWEQTDKLVYLMLASFWILLSTLIRYDGWFLFMCTIGIVTIIAFLRQGLKVAEGKVVLFCTMAGIGIVGWFLWNYLIFHDPLYFAFGPYSAHAQQEVLEASGNLITKGNLLLSIKLYVIDVIFSSNLFEVFLAVVGMGLYFFNRNIRFTTKLVIAALLAPLVFNILALFLGHSVLYIQGISSSTWFNVRYGILMIPSIAIFIGYAISRVKSIKTVLICLLLLVTVFTFVNQDAVTIDDARYGASQKNVTQVSGWLRKHVTDEKGFVLISTASHDATIFSSGLQMSRFIDEGTGKYWDKATKHPDKWARWIVMQHSNHDQTYRLVHNNPAFKKFKQVEHLPFADIYELKPQYVKYLHTQPTLSQK